MGLKEIPHLFGNTVDIGNGILIQSHLSIFPRALLCLWETALSMNLTPLLLSFDFDCSILSLFENCCNQNVLDPFPAV